MARTPFGCSSVMARSGLVAIACLDGSGLESEVSGHFGHSPFFLVAEIGGAKVVNVKTVPSPGHGEGCSMPQFVRGLGVQALVVGGLGPGAAARLDALGVDVFAGVTGKVGDALQALATGALVGGPASCSGHGADGHHCAHRNG